MSSIYHNILRAQSPTLCYVDLCRRDLDVEYSS